MRADRLVSLVLLLRDIDALSAAGVPVYAERGRNDGFALRAASRSGVQQGECFVVVQAGEFGLRPGQLGTPLRAWPNDCSSTRKSTSFRAARTADEVPDAVVAEIRRAVFAGHQVRIRYQAVGQAPKWRTAHPIGLVTEREQGYLLATRDGEDRTYRLSRVLATEELDESAQRPDRVDLGQSWQERSTRFRAGGDQIVALVRIDPERREELARTALAIHAERIEPDGWLRPEAAFQDSRHAEWALWQFATSAEVLSPQALRVALHDRATAISAAYAGPA